MEHNMDNRLWDYIDDNCNAAEKYFVAQLIASQEDWRNQYHELLEIHQLINTSLELDEPSMRFSQNVMDEIARQQIGPATNTYINNKIIYGIGIFFLAMIAGAVVYALGQVHWAGSDMPDGLLSRLTIRRMDTGKFFNNNVSGLFLVANTVTALMLLDMYLGKKQRNIQERQ